MASLRAASSSLVCGASRPSVKPAVSGRVASRVSIKTAAPAPCTSTVSKVATQVAGVEVAQIAGEAGFIAGTAFTMFGITLIGLAVGFVLLRVESLVEEGKL